jgi:hypothetical protein
MPPSEPSALLVEMILDSEPSNYERCLGSSMNDVVNQDTLSATNVKICSIPSPKGRTSRLNLKRPLFAFLAWSMHRSGFEFP